MKDDKDVFEILGINSREDSYTELIKNAFDNSKEFKDNFCILFAGYKSDDFELSVRCASVYIDISTKNKEIPDMILYSKNNNELILIENKIFSGEGYEQTNRYSKSIFLESVKMQFEMKDAKFDKFYFITLDGQKAKSDKFVSMSWSNMISDCSKNVVFQDERLKLLMNDLIEKSIHYMNFKEPSGNTTFKHYFKNCKKWVTKSRAFEVAFKNSCKDIAKKYNVEYTFGIQNNRNGEQLLIVFQNQQWIKYSLKAINLNDLSEEELDEYGNCRNIHVELNWTERENRISLFIHYETNPYLKRRELENYPAKLIERYNENKEIFKQKVYRQIPCGWMKVGRFLTVAKTEISIKDDTTWCSIYEWLNTNFDKAFKCIEASLEEIK
ncbi:MAG: PD-(D/E)XK nuclease family protein [Anaerovorax sp.]|nr:PD-(D/E)XK nuclease family protein [Anaerovorax sp.]